MAMINKELYDALIEANVSDQKATAAAESLVSGKEDTAGLKARLASAEESQNSSKKDVANIQQDISDIKVDIADLKARLTLVEKLQWAVLIGVIGLIIKGFIG